MATLTREVKGAAEDNAATPTKVMAIGISIDKFRPLDRVSELGVQYPGLQKLKFRWQKTLLGGHLV
jgi:hypothetical protein